MRHDDDRKWVGALFKFAPSVLEINELNRRKCHADAAPEQTVAEFTRPPIRMFVGENRKASHSPAMAIIGTIIINVHPFIEIGVLRSLYFDVNDDPTFLTVFQPDLC